MNRYLVRASFKYFPDSFRKRGVQYYGTKGFDWTAPLVPFATYEDARRAIDEFNNSTYRLDHGEYARPTMVVVPTTRAPADVKRELGVLP